MISRPHQLATSSSSFATAPRSVRERSTVLMSKLIADAGDYHRTFG